MTVLTLMVVGAAILLTWMLVHSYSGREAPTKQRTRRAHGGHGSDTWMFAGGEASASDCGAGHAGGGCGDGGGGGD